MVQSVASDGRQKFLFWMIKLQLSMMKRMLMKMMMKLQLKMYNVYLVTYMYSNAVVCRNFVRFSATTIETKREVLLIENAMCMFCRVPVE